MVSSVSLPLDGFTQNGGELSLDGLDYAVLNLGFLQLPNDVLETIGIKKSVVQDPQVFWPEKVSNFESGKKALESPTQSYAISHICLPRGYS
jgi:hypothetical protein